MGKKIIIFTASFIFLSVYIVFAQIPDIGGRVVFCSDRNGFWNIWIHDLDENETFCITDFPGEFGITKVHYPQWSNDGRRIAFIGVVDGLEELFIVDDDGENLRRLTYCVNNTGYAWVPSWDPIDPNIIFRCVVYGGESFVNRLNILTEEDTRIPNSSSGVNTQYFDITSDGNEILFSRGVNRGTFDSHITGYQDMNGFNERIIKPLDHPGEFVGRINRMDNWIVYHENDHNANGIVISNIFKMDKNGNNIIQLTYAPYSGIRNLWPKWTYGGNEDYILFQTTYYYPTSKKYEIVLMKADDISFPNDMINLTNNVIADDWYPDWTPVPSNNAPVVLCKNIEVPADDSCQAVIALEDVDCGSYDPDGDDITLSIDNCGPFPLGDYYVTLTVTDEHGESDTCQAVVTVVDTTPPVPDIAKLPDLIGECFLDDTLKPIATDNCAGYIEGTTTDPLFYSDLGTYIITWTYDDGNGNTAAQTQTVIVEDTTSPVIDISVDPSVLWPPNHKMVLITPTVIISDNCDPIPAAELTSITMNEGDETNTYDPSFDTTVGDGNTSNDIQVDENGNIYLRAERSGTGTGRIYTITYTAIDASGNTATATVIVTVPHNQ